MLTLVTFNREFIESTFNILCDKELREFFLLNREISRIENRRYWEEYLKNKDCNNEVLAILYNNIHIGNCGLKNITNKDAEFWIYIDREFWGMGIGGKILDDLIKQHFYHEKYLSIYLNVSKDNHRAIRLYKSRGFVCFGYNDNREDILRMIRYSR